MSVERDNYESEDYRGSWDREPLFYRVKGFRLGPWAPMLWKDSRLSINIYLRCI